MNTFFKFLQILAFFLFSSSAFADALSSPIDIRHFTDGVMESIGTGNSEGAFKKIKPFIVVADADYEVMIAQMRSQLPRIIHEYGSNKGFEFIQQSTAGESLIRMMYIAKYEKSVMPWTFYFYKTDKGWRLSAFKFDGDLSSIFQNKTP